MVSVADRRRFSRRPKLFRFMLYWKDAEEAVFTTNVALEGMFLRTAAMPPVGAEIRLVLPEARPGNDCLRLEGEVVRLVRRGDPYNPLGGIGIRLVRAVSSRGCGPVGELLRTLLGDAAPDLADVAGPVTVAFPSCAITAGIAEPPQPQAPIEELGFTVAEPMTAQLAVFCRWRNMVIQATLLRLGPQSATIGNLRVRPAPGDAITVRLLSARDAKFGGAQFTGSVERVVREEGATMAATVTLDAPSQQPDVGSLRSLLRKLQDGRER